MITIINGNCRDILSTQPSESFDCVVTSPPYWGLRDYGVAGQIGLEPTMKEYLATMVDVFRELRRVLKPEGTCWLNIGDSYNANYRGGGLNNASEKQITNAGTVDFMSRKAPPRQQGLKPKDLCMIPNRLAIMLQEDGWYVRSEIIWHKPNPMPESVRDRPTCAHEKVWLLTKGDKYFYDADAIREPMAEASANRYKYSFGGAKNEQLKTSDKPTAVVGNRQITDGRNSRNVWTITTKPFRGAHFATMPPDLAERCIKAGCPVGGMVLDPFGGAGTTGLVANKLGRNATLIELNSNYVELANKRIAIDAPLFAALMETEM